MKNDERKKHPPFSFTALLRTPAPHPETPSVMEKAEGNNSRAGNKNSAKY